MAKNSILFISEMKDMKTDASSTQIMTYNLLYGLKEAGYFVTFLAVCNDSCDTESVISDFAPIVNEITCVPSAMNLLSRRRNLLGKYVVQLRYAFFTDWYCKQIDKIILDQHYDIILTHLPAIESAYYANVLKKYFSKAKYIQYWSDPYARTGLSSAEKLPIKRYVMSLLEKNILKQADDIVYGTLLLKETQSMQYPNFATKMRACDVSYNVFNSKKDITPVFVDNKPLTGYVGGYRSTYRNIDPLYTVFNNHPELGNLVLCGFSDIQRNEKSNIKIIERCSPQRAIGIEDQLNIHVCLLNKTMSQIPGKIFYQTNSGKPILIILDGPDQNIIRKYLEKFKRFEFAENNEESIYTAIQNILSGQRTASTESPDSLSPITFAQSVIGFETNT